MTQLKSFIIGKDIKDKEDALGEFWRYQEAHNANRRRKPQEFIKVMRVTKHGEGWWVHYTVPASVLHKKPK